MGGMAGRPALAFAFDLPVEALFAPADAELLAGVCRILDSEPLQRLDDARAAELLAEADILVSGWGCPLIDARVLATAPRLRLIAHAAGTIRGLVTPAVFARGIAVTNAADANAVPVAEYTLAAILLANKRVLEFAQTYRRERRHIHPSHCAEPSVGNWQKTIGIVGASRIGRRVIELLKPFDMIVLVCDPYLSAEEAAVLGAEKRELEALLTGSDVVSLHAPLLPETRHMLDARRLGLMRPGATLINTARGGLVDQDALIAELVSGRISAVLDVTDPDPLPADNVLYDLPNVLLTPHLAGAVGDERHRFGRLIAAEVQRFANGEPLRHAIDAASFARQA